MRKAVFGIFVIMIMGLAATQAFPQNGYSASQGLIGGGGTSTSSTYSVGGSMGEPAVATPASGGAFGVTAGYWANNTEVAPPGTLSVSGFVTTAQGRGITNAIVTITGATLPRPIIDRTYRLGSFTISGLNPNQQYTVTVTSRRYGFNPQSRSVNVTTSDVANINFTAQQ